MPLPSEDLTPSNSLFPSEVGQEQPGDGGIGHSWFVLELTSDHVEPEEPAAPEKVGGSTGHQVYGGGPWMREAEFRFDGKLSLQREVELRPAKGSVTAKAPDVVEFRFSGSLMGDRSVQFVHHGKRTPAQTWARLIAEDEDILLSI